MLEETELRMIPSQPESGAADLRLEWLHLTEGNRQRSIGPDQRAKLLAAARPSGRA